MTTKEGKMKAKEPIPQFASREEEANFWDTHDLADYWDEFKPVKVRFAKNLTAGLTLRLDHETMAKLKEVARQKGMPLTNLVSIWVLERLRQEESQSTPAEKS